MRKFSVKPKQKVAANNATNKSYIKADAAEDMRQQYRDRRAAAHQKKLNYQQGESNKLISEIKEAENSRDKLETLFDILVPAEGPSNYKGGELVRAITRIIYRDMNGGDLFYEGYGIETCADAVAYIVDEIPELFDDFEDIAARHLEEEDYTAAIRDIGFKIADYVVDNPEEAIEKNEADYQKYDGEKFIRDNEWEPTYDYDAMIPDNVQFHLDKGDISERDFIWELESWDSLRDTNIEISGDEVYIDGLRKEQLNEIDGKLYKWLEEYGDSLDDEYGSEEDEEYDEAHEYDEEEEE